MKALTSESREVELEFGWGGLTLAGAWGHSQGGWLAQILASRRPDLSFAICNSGPAIGIAEQDLYGCEHTMRAKSHTEEKIERALRSLAALHQEAAR